MKHLSFLFAAILACATAYCESEEEKNKALQEVMNMLVSPAQRQKLIDDDKKAKEADDFALQVGGNEANRQKIYEIAAKMMQNLTEKSSGDPEQMKKILEEANKDPEGFAKTFTPEQKQMLQDLAKEVEKTKTSQTIH